jgi:hypothetical protein
LPEIKPLYLKKIKPLYLTDFSNASICWLLAYGLTVRAERMPLSVKSAPNVGWQSSELTAPLLHLLHKSLGSLIESGGHFALKYGATPCSRFAMLKTQFDQFVADGFDRLGAFIMVIDGFLADERFQPTIDLLEALGYSRSDSTEVDVDQYAVRTPGGQQSEAALRTFFVNFKMGHYLIHYQPLNRCIFRGKTYTPHRPESDFRFADWYPVKGATAKKRSGKIEDQLADDFPNAAMAGQFLHDHGFARSNTHKNLGKNTYFVASRHGDGQPSGIVFRGEDESFFFDYYADARYIMGASGLLKDQRQTARQYSEAISIAMTNIHGG